MLLFAAGCLTFTVAAIVLILVKGLKEMRIFDQREARREARENEHLLWEHELYRQMDVRKEADDAPTTLPPAA